MSILALLAVTLAVAFGTPFPASAQTTSHRELARDILAELIAIRTVAGTGTTVEAAEAMATRLKDAGFSAEDVLVIGPEPGLGNVVARFRGKGSGGRPILTMAHLDVVDALSEDWSMDPYELIERDGYFYGRGTSDNKAGAATLVANFIRLKKEGFIPDRDLIMVLTADEESTQASIRWLAEERLDLVDAELALNTDGGFGDIQNGKRIRLSLQASEKVYLSFRLEVINKGGHSSRPVPDNAIYHLARGLTGLADFEFPVKLNEVTRAFFEKSAELASGQVASDMKAILTSPPDSGAASRLAESPYYNATMRTTCVATMLSAGHAPNALPQTARAVVNCRILPGESPDEVERTLNQVVADRQIVITRIDEPIASPPSPLSPPVVETIERLANQHFPGVPVVPVMSTGATDGLYVRNAGIPTYGFAAIFEDPDDSRAHGQDERIGVEAYYDSVALWYDLLKAFATR
jgi:acetylornithine deacetylase/succinyl-diaminopimelate desuccinylase-like protein